jgi:AcrR family transcriptional regulator
LFVSSFFDERHQKDGGNFGNEKSFHSFVLRFMTMGDTNTKVRIRDKAKELFLRFGIRSVSMDDIATQLGMSKKTIYQYFTDKNELVDEVVEDDIQHMQADCVSSFAEAKDAIDEIFITVDRLMDQLSNMNPMLIYDLEKFHVRAYQRFMEHKNKFLLQVIRRNMERGITEELYRPDLNVDVLSKFRLDSMMIAFNIDLYPPSRYNLAEVTQLIIEHFVFGLASLKGHKLILKYQQQRNKNGKYYEHISGKAK